MLFKSAQNKFNFLLESHLNHDSSRIFAFLNKNAIDSSAITLIITIK